jgi:predicted DsbA family dithiol-disulfide isomerase
MLKLLSAIILLSSISYAETISEKVEDFLVEEFEDNPRITNIDAEVVDVVEIPKPKNFKAYIVLVKASVKSGAKERKVAQRMVYFSDGNVITKELTDLSSGISMVDYVKPDFKKEFYKKENLIYGNADAKHRVAFFSDPLCPFCRGFVPKAIEEMRKQPNKFAIYYYHFPLDRIHPASVPLVKAAIAAELLGKKDVVLNLYKVKVNAREKNINTILNAFNKAMGTNIVPADLESRDVKNYIARDLQIANYLMIGGTPTVYFDDKIDDTKKKYTKVK